MLQIFELDKTTQTKVKCGRWVVQDHALSKFYDCNDKGKPVVKQGRKAVSLLI
jgi:hypothetical protein